MIRSRSGGRPATSARRPVSLSISSAGHPVVLVVVQHRQQHVEVAEQVRTRHAGGEPDVEVGAVTPVGELRVQRDRRGAAPGSRAARTAPAASASPPRQRQHRQPRRQVQRLCRPAPGAASHVPRSAVPNTLRSATDRNDDAAYGRSLTYAASGNRPSPAAPRQRDRVDLAQQRDRAAPRLRPPGRTRAPSPSPSSTERTAAGFLCSRNPRSVAGGVVLVMVSSMAVPGGSA